MRDLNKSKELLHSPSGQAVIAEIIRDVAELPDRNSPSCWPEVMLVTGDELRIILERHLSAASPTAGAEPPKCPTCGDEIGEGGATLEEIENWKRPAGAEPPQMTQVSSGIFTSKFCACPNQANEDGAHCPICGKLKPEPVAAEPPLDGADAAAYEILHPDGKPLEGYDEADIAEVAAIIRKHQRCAGAELLKYTNRHGEPCSQACGEGRHAECTETGQTCNCTYRGLHKTTHRYLTILPAAPSAEWPSDLPANGTGAMNLITNFWTGDLKGLTKEGARIVDSLVAHVTKGMRAELAYAEGWSDKWQGMSDMQEKIAESLREQLEQGRREIVWVSDELKRIGVVGEHDLAHKTEPFKFRNSRAEAAEAQLATAREAFEEMRAEIDHFRSKK